MKTLKKILTVIYLILFALSIVAVFGNAYLHEYTHAIACAFSAFLFAYIAYDINKKDEL